MYAGYDKTRGFQLYCSDPSGNYASWKAHSTGRNSVNAISTLKEEYEGNLSIKNALILAAKVLGKTMDKTTPDASNFEIAIIQLDADGKPVQRIVQGEELNKILDEAKVFEEKK